VLIEHKKCSVCNSKLLSEKIRIRYDDESFKSFIFDYYNLKERGLESEYDTLTADFSYILQSCNDCNAIMQRFVPDSYFLDRLYGAWMDDKSKSQEKFNFIEYKHNIVEAMQLTEFLVNHFQLSSPSELKVMDFGAGWARFAMALRACGCQVYVCDLSSERLDIYHREGFKVLNYEDIPNQEFHFINTEQSLEHVTEPLKVGAQLYSGLRLNGVLKISVPYFSWAEKNPIVINWDAGRKERNNPVPFLPLEHLNYFRRPSLHYMAKKLGMNEATLSLRSSIDYSLDWTRPRQILKNIGRMLPKKLFKNYFFFEKI